MSSRQSSFAWSAIILLASSFTLVAQQPQAGVSAKRPDGAALFTSNCAGCHGADGRGGEHAPNIATSSAARQLADSDLLHILSRGIPDGGMPAFSWLGPERSTAVMLYLRSLQGRGNTVNLPGDPQRGERLFAGKAQCSSCHKINGNGGFIGSDLSFYGADASPAAIRGVILNPDKNLTAAQKAATVITKGGKKFDGMVRADDNFTLTLQTMDGSFHFLNKADLTTIDLGSHSLMPTNYGSALSSMEVDDLLSYLIRTGTEQAKHLEIGSSQQSHDEE